MNLRRRPELWVMAAYSVFYIALIFPFAYFRHDDWQIISNSVLRLPDDWRFLFSDTLYDLGVATRWFVRPVFKALAFASYPVFGLWYFGWLLEVLAINLAAIWLTCKTLRDLGRGDGAVLIFAIVFCASVHWHLGTQAWIGAGLINAPQLLGCALSLWAFCRFAMCNARGQAAGYLALSIVGYAVALGAKESSVLHVGLLALLCWRVEPLQHIPLSRRLAGVAAIAVVTATYLALRLSLPLNGDYEPVVEVAVAGDVTVLVASVAGPTIALLWALMPLLTSTQRWAGAVFLWPFAVLAGVSMTPYIGHPFFSTNWFFYTGYVWAVALALWGGTAPAIGTTVWPRRAVAALTLMSILPVMAWLTWSGWWQWQHGERQAVEVLRAADASRITRVLVHDCEAPTSRTRLARVIGTDVHLYDLWLLLHRTPATIEVTTCNEGATTSADADPHTLRLRWVFPNLSAF